MNVEKISAITIKVNGMARSVHFYNRLLVKSGRINTESSTHTPLGIRKPLRR
jgi:hypothetical protein